VHHPQPVFHIGASGLASHRPVRAPAVQIAGSPYPVLILNL
jgi:hypothetical protein